MLAVPPTLAISTARMTSADGAHSTGAPHAEFETASAFATLRDATVMMVDDEPVLIDVIQASLEEDGYRNFVATTNPLEALEMLNAIRPDVLLLDVVMPQMNGLEVLKRLRGNPALHETPVIILTAASEPKVKLAALELGAADFLAKPVDPSELVLRLRNTLAAKAYRDRLAYYDPVTGLANRRMFMDRLGWACQYVQRYGQRGALLQVNVDRFKQVNDALGPGAGDLVLRQLGERLARLVRASDTLGPAWHGASDPSLSRLGGDEFSLLLPTIDRAESAAIVAQRLLDSLHGDPFHNGVHEIFLTASIGIAVFPADGNDVDTVLKNVGAALREAKNTGRNRFQFYAKELNARALNRLNVESELHRALARDELRLHFQPKVDAHRGAVTGAEALVRWQHPQRGLLGPMEFIPVAELSDLILPLGDWVLTAACEQIVTWQQRGLPFARLSVNVSSLQLRDPGFVGRVERTLAATGVDTRYLAIELTETVILDKSKRTTQVLETLRGLGITLSIDDFGAGFTSLGYLKRLPFNELKIDKSFIDDVDTDRDSAAIVAAVIGLAHNLGLKVVAEGVETAAQHAILAAKGCDECQGYFFSRPLNENDFVAWLGARAT